MERAKQEALEYIEQRSDLLFDMSDRIWEHPQVGFTEHYAAQLFSETLEKEGIPMASAEVTMIPQTYVTLSDEQDIKMMNRILDMLDEDDDVQEVYHNWDE